MADTKIVRLTTGEEIIAKVEDKGSTVKLSKGLLLIPMQEGKLSFATWLPYNEDEHVEVNKEAIMFMLNPVTQMANQYAEATGSVVVPEQKIII
jgi:hypothetical protein